MHLFNKTFKEAKKQVKDQIDKEELEKINQLAASKKRRSAQLSEKKVHKKSIEEIDGNIQSKKRRNATLEDLNAIGPNKVAQLKGKKAFTVKAFYKKVEKDHATWINLLEKKELITELTKRFTLGEGDLELAKDTIELYRIDINNSELHGGESDSRHNILPPSAPAGTIFYHTSGSKALDTIDIIPGVEIQKSTASLFKSHAVVKSGAIIHPIIGQAEEHGRTKVAIAKTHLKLNNLSYDKNDKGEYIGWVYTSELKKMKTIIEELMGSVGDIDNAHNNINRVIAERALKFLAGKLFPISKKVKKLIGQLGKGGSNIVTKTATKAISKGVKKGTDAVVDKAVGKVEHELYLLLMETSTKLDDAIKNAKIESGEDFVSKKVKSYYNNYTKIIVEKLIGMVPVVNKGYKLYKTVDKLYVKLTGIRNEMIKALKSYEKILSSISVKEYKSHPVTDDLIMELSLLRRQELFTTKELLNKLKSIQFNKENPALTEYEELTFEQDIEADLLRFNGNGGEDELEQVQKTMHKYGTELEKVYKDITDIQENISKVDDKEKNKLLINYSKKAKEMKKLCAEWDKEVKPYTNILGNIPKAQEYEKIHASWTNLIEQRQKAKRGETDDISAIEMMEEHIYAKALTDVENFWASFDSDELVPQEYIDKEVENLEKHLFKWQTYVTKNGGESCMPDELVAMVEMLDNIRQEWARLKPLMQKLLKKDEELQTAMTKEEHPDVVKGLLKELEGVHQQINL